MFFFGTKTLQEFMKKHYNFTDTMFEEAGITEDIKLRKHGLNEKKLKTQLDNTEGVLVLKDRTILFYDVGHVRIFIHRNSDGTFTYKLEDINKKYDNH